MGNAPIFACLQSKCIACLPRPHETLAGRLGAAPSTLGFGDPVAHAGPRPVIRSKTESKRAGSVNAPPARAISTKNKHLLVIYKIPTRGFTAVVLVFRGTPPAKPLRCKSVSNRSGALRACLKIERGPSTRLLALAGVGSTFTARCGDAQASPPWPPPKSTAAGPLSIFRQPLISDSWADPTGGKHSLSCA